jgi:hypothetical protein
MSGVYIWLLDSWYRTLYSGMRFLFLSVSFYFHYGEAKVERIYLFMFEDKVRLVLTIKSIYKNDKNTKLQMFSVKIKENFDLLIKIIPRYLRCFLADFSVMLFLQKLLIL